MTVQLWVLASVLLAFGLFSVRMSVTGRSVSGRVRKQGASPLLGLYLMEFAYWVLSPLEKMATGLKLSPNIFSWACLILGALAGAVAALGHVSLAGGLAIISALLDALDGMVARSRGIASDAGEVLDAAVDRYTEFFFLGGFCIYYRFEPWAMVLTLLALLGSFLVSYSQAKGEAMSFSVPKGLMRRPERAVYLGAGAFLSPMMTRWFEMQGQQPLHYPLLFSIVLVAVFANATALHRFILMYDELKKRARRP